MVNWQATQFKNVQHPRGPVPQHVIDEANEDLDNLSNVLQSVGINVYRPNTVDFTQKVTTNSWSTDQMYAYCPRDTHLIVGDMVIETPMTYRARQFEAECLADVRKAAIDDGARWIAAPRPGLPLSTFQYNVQTDEFTLSEDEPIFDAANCLRLNDNILYLKSMTGNNKGAQWLQSILGRNYHVQIIDNIYAYAHIDSTFAPIHEGLVVVNHARVNDINMPAVFKKWEKIWQVGMVPQSYYQYPYASAWIGMNLLMIDEATAIVEESQTGLITELEQRKIEVWPLPMRHARTLGGGFHCVTLDLERA